MKAINQHQTIVDGQFLTRTIRGALREKGISFGPSDYEKQRATEAEQRLFSQLWEDEDVEITQLGPNTDIGDLVASLDPTVLENLSPASPTNPWYFAPHSRNWLRTRIKSRLSNLIREWRREEQNATKHLAGALLSFDQVMEEEAASPGTWFQLPNEWGEPDVAWDYIYERMLPNLTEKAAELVRVLLYFFDWADDQAARILAAQHLGTSPKAVAQNLRRIKKKLLELGAAPNWYKWGAMVALISVANLAILGAVN